MSKQQKPRNSPIGLEEAQIQYKKVGSKKSYKVRVIRIYEKKHH